MATKTYFVVASSLLLAVSLLQGTLAYQFNAVNNASSTPGGQRFDKEIGVAYTAETMPKIADFIWEVFQQKTDADKRHFPDEGDVITTFVTDLPGDALGVTGKNNVYMSAKGIEGFIAGSAQFQFTSILYHEMTHVFQWSGEGTAPGGLTEGFADYVVLKSPFVVGGYSTPGQGSRWDEGYGTTSRFLEYCDSLRPGFPAELNKMMREVYKEEYFKDLLGKSVDELWKEYKAKYGNIPVSESELLQTHRIANRFLRV